MRLARIPPSRRVWIFDLDNTLHDATVHIFPSMHEQINDYLMRHFGVDEEGANAMRRGFWQRYGTTLNGNVVTKATLADALRAALERVGAPLVTPVQR